MCLASFVAGLSGVVSRQVRYTHPRTLHEALNLALAVDEAERQERRNETFCTRSDELAGQLLSQQIRRIAKETTLRVQLTQGRVVSRITLRVALGQELRIAAHPGVTNVEV